MNIISNKAKIGNNVSFGDYVTIYDNVEIGDNSVIESYCEIGYPTELAENQPTIIGPNSRVRSHSVLYQGSIFGPQLLTGHGVTVREKTVAGENLQIGTLCDIQGDCIIGNFVRFHSNVHVGKKTQVGNFVWVFPYVVFTNDPTPPSETLIGSLIMDYVSIATMSVVLPGVVIGSHALVGAHSLVSKDVPEGMLVAGVPAQVIGPTSKIKLRDGSGSAAYPWTRHFHRGYPPEIVENWKKNFADINNDGP
jgi:acetyltransferase-like isoleucine patch superfamily enzyme